jgi:hypothetical protein
MTSNMVKYRVQILVQVFWDVRIRLLAKGRFKSLSSCLELVYKWNLHSLL